MMARRDDRQNIDTEPWESKDDGFAIPVISSYVARTFVGWGITTGFYELTPFSVRA
jgi:hypothetical protein